MEVKGTVLLKTRKYFATSEEKTRAQPDVSLANERK